MAPLLPARRAPTPPPPPPANLPPRTHRAAVAQRACARNVTPTRTATYLRGPSPAIIPPTPHRTCRPTHTASSPTPATAHLPTLHAPSACAHALPYYADSIKRVTNNIFLPRDAAVNTLTSHLASVMPPAVGAWYALFTPACSPRSVTGIPPTSPPLTARASPRGLRRCIFNLHSFCLPVTPITPPL